MSHVFISYSRQDEAFARQLVADLQAAGIAVWFDKLSIQPGEQWDKAIENGLKAAIAVVVIISPTSMASDNVRNEINFARDNDQLLLPILYRFAQVFLNLESIQWIDLSTEALYLTNFGKLTTRIGQETPLLKLKPTTPAPESSLFSGVAVDVTRDALTVTNDSRQLSRTQLRRYLRVLGVIASPFASSDEAIAPAAYIDLNLAWRNLASAIATAHQLEPNAPYAVVRLAPPTAAKLTAALHGDAAEDAYQIVHFVAHSQDDKLYLEDENGGEALLDAAQLKTIFGGSAVRLVIIGGVFSDSLAQTLLDQTEVQAVLYANQPVAHDAAVLFDSRFYAQLAGGADVASAVSAARDALRASHPQLADGYQLKHKGTTPITIALPNERADKPLIDPSLPRLRNVPINLNFVGQSTALKALYAHTTQVNTRQVTIYGLGGIGKSWLASEYIARFGWRYPDGILWMHICEQTKSEDIIGQLLALLELPASMAWGDLRVQLRNRRVLVVLDQANEWTDPLEVGELADFIARLDTVGGTRFMITAWSAVEPLTHTSGTREYILNEMARHDAELLLQRLIATQGLQAEFDRVPNSQATFLEKTFYTPWLINEGLELVKLDGLEAALEDLQSLPEDVFEVLALYIGRQVARLDGEMTATREFLRRLQGIPDSFDRRTAQAIGGEAARQHLRELLRRNLLRREGTLYNLPATVRAYLRQHLPLTETEQDDVDTALIKEMLSSAQVANV